MPEPIACRLTAALPGAIATIAVHGADSGQVINRLLNKPPATLWPQGELRFMHWPILAGAAEHVVVCRVDKLTIEIHCHGGEAVCLALLDQLAGAGCHIVQQNQWALLANMDAKCPEQYINRLCQLAALKAQSERTVGMLLDQADGRLFRGLERLSKLIDAHDWMSAKRHLQQLTRWNELGTHLIAPWKVVLAGPPNVGKSSLINALTGQGVAIVHHQAGTTRDWLEATTVIDGWPVLLTDTAGLHPTEDSIERQGVDRAWQQVAAADLVILVVDILVGWTSQHDQIAKLCTSLSPRPRLLVACNKLDQLPHSTRPAMPGIPTVYCSAQQDIASLLTQLSELLVPELPNDQASIIFDVNQQDYLQEINRLLESPVDSTLISKLKFHCEQLLINSCGSPQTQYFNKR